MKITNDIIEEFKEFIDQYNKGLIQIDPDTIAWYKKVVEQIEQSNEVVFELMTTCRIGYLVHYAFPYTGSGEYDFPAGSRFLLRGKMRDDAIYMDFMTEDNGISEKFYNSLIEKEKRALPQLENRISGFSFFITKEQLEAWQLNFISGSKEDAMAVMDNAMMPMRRIE